MKNIKSVNILRMNQKLINEAAENFINFLKDEWDGGISGGKKGLTNIKAQTRIAASYRLIQLTYPTAIATRSITE